MRPNLAQAAERGHQLRRSPSRPTSSARIATGNIGCITKLRTSTSIPVCHTVELLDWATGGPKPAALH